MIDKAQPIQNLVNQTNFDNIERSQKLSSEKIDALKKAWSAMKSGVKLSLPGFEIENGINQETLASSIATTKYKIFYQHKHPGEIYY